MTASSILGQFQQCADEATFPELNNGYYYPVDCRLHLFRDATRWAMLVELLGYSTRGRNLVDVLHFFGNCLTEGTPGFDDGDFLDRIDNMGQVEQLECHSGEEYYSGNYAGGTTLIVRGQPLPLVGALQGTPLETVCRMLVPEYRDLLLADAGELRRRIPADLPRLMTLEEWHQPWPFVDDLLAGDLHEHETFRMIAEVLASGDTGLYQPTLGPNTYWSNWPDAGTL